MRKKIVLKALLAVLLPLLIVGSISAQELTGEPVTAEMARTVATSHVEIMESEWKAVPELEGQEVTVGEVRDLSHPETEELLGYVVDLAPRGFVAVPGNTAIHPVIAYSFHGNFFFDEDPENHLLWMLTYDLNLRHELLSKTPRGDLQSATDLWEDYLGPQARAAVSSVHEYPGPSRKDLYPGGWIRTTYTQGSPYNDYCPLDTVTGKRCLVGCTATAFAQLVFYWTFDIMRECPFLPLDTGDAYVSRSLDGSLVIRIPDDCCRFQFWGFDGMNCLMETYKYNCENTKYDLGDIGTLPFVCGILTKTGYSSSVSGAYVESIPSALANKFYFRAGGDPVDGSDTSFYHRLAANMMDSMPAVFHISQTQGSGEHSIICDGLTRFIWEHETIDTIDHYHLNFGWGMYSPDPISMAWYHLPDSMPAGYDLIRKGILDILP